MKKKLLVLSTSIFLLCAVLLMSSCQLSEIFNKNDTTVADNTSQNSETTAPSETEIPIDELYPKYDFSAITDYTSIVTLGKFIGREVSYENINVTEEEYLDYVNSVLISMDYFNEITTGNTAENNIVNISYIGYIDDAVFEGGSAEDQQLTLNDTSGYIDGFADGLIGKEVGSTVKLELKFPNDYHSADYAGKDVVFDVTINFIYEIHELTNEIVINIMEDSEDCTTVEKFHEFFISKSDTAEEKRSNAISVMWDELMAESIVLDEAIFNQQRDYYYYMMLDYYEQLAAAYSMELAEVLSYLSIDGTEGIMDVAKDYAKFDMVFNAIIYTNNLEISDEDYPTLLAEYAAEIDMTSEELQETYEEDDIKSFLLERIINDLMYDSIVITNSPNNE